jgi:hypothetical protein
MPLPVPATAKLAVAPAAVGNVRTPWLNRVERTEEEEAQTESKPFWNKIGLWDIIAVLVWVKLTDMLWVYAIHNV